MINRRFFIDPPTEINRLKNHSMRAAQINQSRKHLISQQFSFREEFLKGRSDKKSYHTKRHRQLSCNVSSRRVHESKSQFHAPGNLFRDCKGKRGVRRLLRFKKTQCIGARLTRENR